MNAYQVTWFSVPDSFNHFEVVIRGRIDTVEKNGMFTCRQTLTLTSFDSGINTIPSLAVNFDPFDSDSTLNLFTDSIQVNVLFSPMDSTATFHDIKTIIEVKNEIPFWMWIGGAALLILLIVLIIYLIKYLKNRKKNVSLFSSKLTPFDEAMQSLSLLQKEELVRKREVKQFHIKLGDIFKKYISRKTGRNIFILTSSDILILLNNTLLSKVDTSLVAGNLRMTDAVKFAKYSPPAAESEVSFINTKNSIEQIEKLIFAPDSDNPGIK